MGSIRPSAAGDVTAASQPACRAMHENAGQMQNIAGLRGLNGERLRLQLAKVDLVGQTGRAQQDAIDRKPAAFDQRQFHAGLNRGVAFPPLRETVSSSQ